MSYDFALEKICTHEVMFESVRLAPGTFDSIRFPRPPVNQRITLYVNGVQVTEGGLSTTPELPFSKSEPYRTVPGRSDLLYAKSPGGTPRIVELVTGNDIPAADIARDLSRKLPDLAFAVQNGRVMMRARTAGPDGTFSFPDPRWTDRTSSLPNTGRILGGFSQLGIVPGRVATSKLLYPGWDLAPDQTSPIAASLIQFRAPILNANPVFQIGYFTDASNCRRCQGTRIEYDYNVINGKYETVDGADLLAQEFDKFLFTRSATHFKWPWLGSKLIDRIGGKVSQGQVTASAMITLDVTQAFRVYQNIKTQQDTQFPFQAVSDAEFPLALGEISVRNPPGDPTTAIVVTSVASRSRESVVLKRLVGNPNPFVLSGGGSPFKLRG